MVSRLEQSFEQAATRSNEDVAEDMKNVWARYGDLWHRPNMQGDLLRATEALVTAIEELQDRAAITKAVARVKQVTRAIDVEAAAMVRRMHTT